MESNVIVGDVRTNPIVAVTVRLFPIICDTRVTSHVVCWQWNSHVSLCLWLSKNRTSYLIYNVKIVLYTIVDSYKIQLTYRLMTAFNFYFYSIPFCSIIAIILNYIFIDSNFQGSCIIFIHCFFSKKIKWFKSSRLFWCDPTFFLLFFEIRWEFPKLIFSRWIKKKLL